LFKKGQKVTTGEWGFENGGESGEAEEQRRESL